MKRLLLAALLLALSFPALSTNLKATPPRQAPPLPIPLLGGHKIDVPARHGKVLLVSFWATWCPPCRKEMPSMDRLAKMMARHPFMVLAINAGEPEDMVERFLDEMPVSFSVGLDEDGSRAKAWKAFVYPTSYLVDKQGRIRYGVTGTMEWDAPEVVEVVEQLLRE